MIAWDNYWKEYSPSKAEQWLISERDKIITKYLDKMGSQRKKVIEVGCGFGSNLRIINKSRTDVECYALDSSQEAIRSIRREIENAVVSDCRNTDFENNKFDVVYSAGLMEHFEDEVPFLTEMKRILKENGFILTFVPARYSLWKLYQLLHFGLWQHGYEKAYTYENLRSLFLCNGFHIKEIIGIDPFSISGFLMKVLNVSFDPPIKRTPQKSAYTELCVIAKKNHTRSAD
jgi:SAM-dependent methyltransferase